MTVDTIYAFSNTNLLLRLAKEFKENLANFTLNGNVTTLRMTTQVQVLE
jgi:hypothetical protein